eukprot:13173558-Alexandrium_andersonii.AAC.1
MFTAPGAQSGIRNPRRPVSSAIRLNLRSAEKCSKIAAGAWSLNCAGPGTASTLVPEAPDEC